MNWTTKTPTEPGWYWWRKSIAYHAEIVKVIQCGGVFGGQWFGPLQEPGGDVVDAADVARISEGR